MFHYGEPPEEESRIFVMRLMSFCAVNIFDDDIPVVRIFRVNSMQSAACSLQMSCTEIMTPFFFIHYYYYYCFFSVFCGLVKKITLQGTL